MHDLSLGYLVECELGRAKRGSRNPNKRLTQQHRREAVVIPTGRGVEGTSRWVWEEVLEESSGW